MTADELGGDALVLAVDIGGTNTKAEVADRAGVVLASATRPTPYGPRAFDAAAELGEKLLAELPDAQRARVARAGLVLPGIVDAAAGIAVFSANIGWRDVDVPPIVSTRWDLPVLIDHDVTVAGWAEWRAGAGQGVDNVCVVIIGTGIAGVLAVNGRLVRGGRGQAGEYGHIPVRPDGQPCPCGNIGCVETVASATAIARAYSRRSQRPVAGAVEVFAALATDPIARAVWADAVAALADGLVGLIYAVCPEVLVLGGGLARAGSAVTRPLRDALDERLFLVEPPDVLVGAFGARAGLVGAAMLARHGSRDETL